jgi:hypothetical protein
MEGADPRTDGELLVATGSDPEAFGTFFRRHARGVLAFFRRRGASAEVALDLPDQQREAVRARVVEGRGYEEIAGELRCSLSVVRQRVSRGLAAIRTRFEELSGVAVTRARRSPASSCPRSRSRRWSGRCSRCTAGLPRRRLSRWASRTSPRASS